MNGQQLKNSILQMAVQGKLVPQDPNDEPASVLLERIRKEKEQLIKEGKIKKEKNPSRIFRGADNLPYEQIGENDPVCIADEVPFDIPVSWEWVRLGCLIYNHGQMTPSENFCYIDIGSINNNIQKLSDEENIIIPEKAPSRARKIVKYGDILYSTVRPYLHNMCIINRDFSHTPIASTGFAVMCCPNNYSNEFLFYYLMSPYFDSYANDTDNAKGVAYPAINDQKLYNALIPVPPLNEQKKIIEKFKTILPSVEKYGAKEEVLSQLNVSFPEQLKKSILQQAVMGKLVPQDENDEPASVLLERIRAEKQKLIAEGKIKKDKNESVIFRRDNSHYEKLNGIERCIDDDIPFEIPANWMWSKLGNCLDVRDGTHDTPKYVQTGIPLVTSKNLKEGYIDFSTVKYISEYDHNIISQRSKVDKGDILYAMIGSIGNPVLYKGNDVFSIKNMALFKNIKNIINMEYIYYYLLLVQNDMKKYASGGVQSFVSLTYLRNYFIPIPPISEQKRIVNKVKELSKTIKLLAE